MLEKSEGMPKKGAGHARRAGMPVGTWAETEPSAWPLGECDPSPLPQAKSGLWSVEFPERLRLRAGWALGAIIVTVPRLLFIFLSELGLARDA